MPGFRIQIHLPRITGPLLSAALTHIPKGRQQLENPHTKSSRSETFQVVTQTRDGTNVNSYSRTRLARVVPTLRLPKGNPPPGGTPSQTGSSGAPCTSCGRRGKRALYLQTPASNCTKMSLGRPTVAARSRGAARRGGPSGGVEGAEAGTALGVQPGPALPAPLPERGDGKPARPRRIQQERRAARLPPGKQPPARRPAGRARGGGEGRRRGAGCRRGPPAARKVTAPPPSPPRAPRPGQGGKFNFQSAAAGARGVEGARPPRGPPHPHRAAPAHAPGPRPAPPGAAAAAAQPAAAAPDAERRVAAARRGPL